MNQEIKKRWVDALRSGKYKQCTGALHKTDGGFCVLGVLCDLYDSNLWTQAPCNDIYYDFSKWGHSYLPKKVIQWADIGSIVYCGPQVDFNDSKQYLSDLNDRGLSFVELADIIDQQL